MKKLLFTLIFAGLLPAQTPTISLAGARNAASLLSPALPGGGVAQGARFALRGTNLGPDSEIAQEDFPIQTSLGGYSVQVAVGGSMVDAFVLRARSGQITALLPSSTPVGTGTVTVTTPNGSAQDAIKVVARAFGIFARSGEARGPAVAKSTSDQSDISFASAAKPGQQVTIQGTGLGAVSGDESAGAVPGDIAAPVEVRVGLKVANLIAKGRSASVAGVDEITFEVPAGIEGCYVPVTVNAGGAISNSATLSISSSSNSCSDPNGFTQSQTDLIQSGAGLKVGVVSLNRSSAQAGPATSLRDTGSADFVQYGADQIGGSSSLGFTPPAGACAVYGLDQSGAGVPDAVLPTLLNAGDLTITGPKGSKKITANGPGVELGSATVLPSIPGLPFFPSNAFLESGSYTLSSTGGSDIGPINTVFTLPAAINWKVSFTGQFLPVPRSQDLLIEWSGGGATDIVTMTGVSVSALSAQPAIGMFICTEKASAQQFKVPAYILSALPASPVGVGSGSLSVGSTPAGDGFRFSAGGLDYGSIIFSSFSLRIASYQ